MEESMVEAHLKTMLEEAGLDMTKPNPLVAWNVFKAFANEPVNCAQDDDFFFACGVFDFTGENLFYLEFGRQFAIDKDSDDERWEQLHIVFTCKPTKDLASLNTKLRTEDFPNKDTFFTKIAELAESRQVTNQTSWHCKVYQLHL